MPAPLSAEKTAAARAFAEVLVPGKRICLTTHVNPDGDGLGSEVGLLRLLKARGVDAVITNPSPTPDRYDFLFRGVEGVDRTAEAVKEIRRADLVVVLDIGDLGRLGSLAESVRERGVPVACVDHHLSGGTLPQGPRYVDAEAAATGELIFELAQGNGWALDADAARALYVAIFTDTGGFRFSNTRPRTLRTAAALLETGLDTEQIYLDLYASAPEGRIRLLAEALETLVVEEGGLAWVTVPPGAMERHHVAADDLDGVVEYPRSIQGGAPRPPLPGDRRWPDQGLLPVRGGCGRGGTGAAVRWRGARQGRGRVASGVAGGSSGDRPGRRPGLSGGAGGALTPRRPLLAFVPYACA